MEWTNDPAHDYDVWVRKQEMKQEELYICAWCGERITDDTLFKVGDDRYCERCANELFRVSNITI